MRRRIVAAKLRELRAATGETQQDVETAVGLGASALTRYEGCISSMSGPVAEKLFRHYGIEGDELEVLLQLVTQSRKRGWLKGFAGVVPEWLEGLVALERDASAISELAFRVIPGLLQTEEYARAQMQAGSQGSTVDQYVKARMARAAVLTSDDPPKYWVVLCESALRCLIGGHDVMRSQLQHLLVMANKPHITVQVLPDSHGAHPSMITPFTLLRFSIAPHYGVVYMDYLTGSLYRDDPEEVERYDQAYRHLIKTALPENQSLNYIAALQKEMK